MLQGALLVGIPEAYLDQAHVEAGALGDLDGGWRARHRDIPNLAESES
jgi:hypothetical protein